MRTIILNKNWRKIILWPKLKLLRITNIQYPRLSIIVEIFAFARILPFLSTHNRALGSKQTTSFKFIFAFLGRCKAATFLTNFVYPGPGIVETFLLQEYCHSFPHTIGRWEASRLSLHGQIQNPRKHSPIFNQTLVFWLLMSEHQKILLRT